MYGKILEECRGARAFIGTGKNFKDMQDHKMPSNFKKLIAVSSFFTTETEKEAKGVSNYLLEKKTTIKIRYRSCSKTVHCFFLEKKLHDPYSRTVLICGRHLRVHAEKENP